jgi:hypothetical protein
MTQESGAIKYFILDTREKSYFEAGHLPCAYHLDPQLLQSSSSKQLNELFGDKQLGGMRGYHFVFVNHDGKVERAHITGGGHHLDEKRGHARKTSTASIGDVEPVVVRKAINDDTKSDTNIPFATLAPSSLPPSTSLMSSSSSSSSSSTSISSKVLPTHAWLAPPSSSDATSQFMYHFLSRGFQHVSLCEGGFDACHHIIVPEATKTVAHKSVFSSLFHKKDKDKSEKEHSNETSIPSPNPINVNTAIIDHNPKRCIVCTPSSVKYHQSIATAASIQAAAAAAQAASESTAALFAELDGPPTPPVISTAQPSPSGSAGSAGSNGGAVPAARAKKSPSSASAAALAAVNSLKAQSTTPPPNGTGDSPSTISSSSSSSTTSNGAPSTTTTSGSSSLLSRFRLKPKGDKPKSTSGTASTEGSGVAIKTASSVTSATSTAAGTTTTGDTKPKSRFARFTSGMAAATDKLGDKLRQVKDKVAAPSSGSTTTSSGGGPSALSSKRLPSPASNSGGGFFASNGLNELGEARDLTGTPPVDLAHWQSPVPWTSTSDVSMSPEVVLFACNQIRKVSGTSRGVLLPRFIAVTRGYVVTLQPTQPIPQLFNPASYAPPGTIRAPPAKSSLTTTSSSSSSSSSGTSLSSTTGSRSSTIGSTSSSLPSLSSSTSSSSSSSVSSSLTGMGHVEGDEPDSRFVIDDGGDDGFGGINDDPLSSSSPNNNTGNGNGNGNGDANSNGDDVNSSSSSSDTTTTPVVVPSSSSNTGPINGLPSTEAMLAASAAGSSSAASSSSSSPQESPHQSPNSSPPHSPKQVIPATSSLSTPSSISIAPLTTSSPSLSTTSASSMAYVGEAWIRSKHSLSNLERITSSRENPHLLSFHWRVPLPIVSPRGSSNGASPTSTSSSGVKSSICVQLFLVNDARTCLTLIRHHFVALNKRTTSNTTGGVTTPTASSSSDVLPMSSPMSVDRPPAELTPESEEALP